MVAGLTVAACPSDGNTVDPFERVTNPIAQNVPGYASSGLPPFQRYRHLVVGNFFYWINRTTFRYGKHVGGGDGGARVDAIVAHDMLTGDSVWEFWYRVGAEIPRNWTGNWEIDVAVTPQGGDCVSGLFTTWGISWDVSPIGASPPPNTVAFQEGSTSGGLSQYITSLLPCERLGERCVNCGGIERGVPV
jgi:hypothetical protein